MARDPERCQPLIMPITGNSIPTAVLDARLAALKAAMEEAFLQRDKTVHAAWESMNRRLETMNEMRAQMAVQKADFISRDEFNPMRDTLSHTVTRVEHETVIAQFNAMQLRMESALHGAPTRVELQNINDRLSSNSNRIAALESRFYLGGAGIIAVITILQIIINAAHLFH